MWSRESGSLFDLETSVSHTQFLLTFHSTAALAAKIHNYYRNMHRHTFFSITHKHTHTLSLTPSPPTLDRPEGVPLAPTTCCDTPTHPPHTHTQRTLACTRVEMYSPYWPIISFLMCIPAMNSLQIVIKCNDRFLKSAAI